jgi:cell division protein FtsL
MARTKRGREKPHFGSKFLINAAIVLFVIFCSVSIITTQNSIAEKKKELAVIEQNIIAITDENDELKEIVSDDDINRYMEKLAEENYGYAYPDERRYYDKSRDN